jgi:hypothetical protein
METPSRFPIDANKRVAEHRHYLRLPSGEASVSDAELFFGDDQHCQARVLNVSAGGVLCRLPETGPLPSIHDSINPLLLFRDGREPISFTGTVRRLEYRAGDMACAIEFSEAVPRTEREPRRKQDKPDTTSPERAGLMAGRISAENFIGRLYTTPAFRSSPAQSWADWQKQMETSFRDIFNNLPKAERWWFLHVIEVLKETEPDYPDTLLAEYVRLCKKGFDKSSLRGVA